MASHTVLYSQGNTASIGQMYVLYIDLSIHLKVSLMGLVDKTTHNSHKFGFKLSPTNYGYWIAMIEPFLITNNLFGYIDGTIPCPPATIPTVGPFDKDVVPPSQLDPNFTTWLSNDAHVRMLILSTISEASFQHVSGNSTSRDLWLSLERAYAPHTASREYTLKGQLLRIEMKADETTSAYLTRTQEYATALANIKEPMKDKDIVMVVVARLRDEYNSLKSTILSRQHPTVFTELHGLLADHDYMIRKSLPSVPTTQAFMAASNSPLNGVVASASSQPATVQDIQQLLGQLGLHNQPTKAATTQAFYTNRGGMGRGRNFHNRRVTVPPTLATQASSSSWLPDTGSINHAAPDLSGFEYVEPYYGENNLHVGNGTALPILHIGSKRFFSPNKTFSLTDILHVPQIKRNLLSVQKFCHDNDVFFEFHSTFFVVKDKFTRTTLLTSPSNDGLYSITLSQVKPVSKVAFSSVRASPHTWHQQLGHPHSQLLKPMISKLCLPVSNKKFGSVCDSCLIGKSSKLHLPLSDYKSSHILDLIVCDVWD
ncbi:hypothetical protein E3N88_11079 [Mikania micrantha]|uniref:Uncharacterized protein n=1 Tax=Mikania micrantha TaxID=192012 RepID=A0A5N6PDH5_9ASTR|nr:hypothetical protein E3N88_11079 [Mikania micrantha]